MSMWSVWIMLMLIETPREHLEDFMCVLFGCNIY